MYKTARSSRVESCRIKCPDAARLNFVSRTAVIVRDGCYLAFGIAVERFIVYLKATRQSATPLTVTWIQKLHSTRLLRTATHSERLLGAPTCVSCRFRHILRPHIAVCKTSTLKFSIAVDFFTCALFKEHYWTRSNVTDLNFVGVQPPPPPLPLTVDSNWTRLDSVGRYAP